MLLTLVRITVKAPRLAVLVCKHLIVLKFSDVEYPASAPAAKKQKLQYSNKSLQSLEATIILSTAPPLYLDPVKDIEEAQALLDKLHDPLCSRDPPAPKSRKRTIAELAADEALAAEEQRFMLIMDERHAQGSTTTSTGKAVATDSEGNGANFEARFERFKTLEEIKEMIREKAQQVAQQNEEEKQRKAKADQERAQEQRVQMANARRQEQQMIRNQSVHQNTGSQQVSPAQHQQPQQHQSSSQPQIPPGATQHAHPATSNVVLSNAHQLAVSQGSQSSPVVRNMTPHNASSPAMGSAMHRGPSGVQMNMTNSAQGAGSPPRPGSALQHGHPGPVPMSAQRSQQPPSRNGTPSMPNGTPRLQQATPIMRNMTPTPRMSQASPVNSASAATPMMGHSMLGAAHINGQPHVTPQHQQAYMQAQHQQQLARQRAHMQQPFQQQHMHGNSPPNVQLQQQHLQQLAVQQAQQRASLQPHNQEAYRQMLQQQQLQAQAGNAGMMNGMTMQQGQNLSMGQPQGNYSGGPGSMMNEREKQHIQMTAKHMFESMRAQAIQHYGPSLSQETINNMRSTAINNAKNQFVQRRRAMAQQQAAMNHMQQNEAMNGMGGM